MSHPSGSTPGGTLIGRVIIGHEVVQVLGEGGMGEVYIAHHQILGTPRALKVIHDDIKHSPNAVGRFKREAMVLGQLRHPNIVDVIDYGQLDNGWPFLLLELIEGGDVSRWLRWHGAMPLVTGLEVLVQLAGVLEYAHTRGVVHRDLKPGNMLLRHNDPRQVKVIDFGLVKLLSAEMVTRLTVERQVMGSPHYMAPEQANALPEITGAADVYALAGIAYELLSGRPVFAHEAPLALICAQAKEIPPRLSARMHVPRRLDNLLYACLAKDPMHRPPTSIVAQQLRDLWVEAGGRPMEAVLDARVPSPTPAAPRVADWAPAGPGASVEAGSFEEMAHDSPIEPSLLRIELSKRIAREAEVMNTADVIFAPIQPGDRLRMREAMQRQMVAIVRELADTLAVDDHDVDARRHAILTLEGQVSDIELDAALLESEIAAADAERRVDLEGWRVRVATRIGQLRQRLDAEQRELAVVVSRKRGAAPDVADALYRELDDLVSRARSLSGARG